MRVSKLWWKTITQFLFLFIITCTFIKYISFFFCHFPRSTPSQTLGAVFASEPKALPHQIYFLGTCHFFFVIPSCVLFFETEKDKECWVLEWKWQGRPITQKGDRALGLNGIEEEACLHEYEMRKQKLLILWCVSGHLFV